MLYSSTYRTGLLSGFQRLRLENRMCDVVLEAGGVSFPCHRALLASSSEYFWALFGETTAERSAGSVSLPLLTAEGLDALLDFLYSGWLSVSSSSLSAVLQAARYLQVAPAVAICERFMVDGLNAENCCCYANLAEHYMLTNVLEASHQTISAEMKMLLQTNRDDLLQLNFRSLMQILDMMEIPGVQEVELVKLALDWLDENGPLPLVNSNLLLSRLRFGLVSASDIASLNHRALATPLIRGQLTQALAYHTTGSAQPISQSRLSTLRAFSNRVLLVGGASSGEGPERQMLAFDPRCKKFWFLKSRLPLRLRDYSVCSVGGFLFVMGGQKVRDGDEDGLKSDTSPASNQVWRFDPRFDSWQQVASMLERRSKFSCCVMDDIIYATGGRHTGLDTEACASVASVEFYDLAIGAWRRGASMPRPLYGHASAVLNDCIYVSGGRSAHTPTVNAGNYNSNQDGPREGSKEVFCWKLQSRVWEKRTSMSIGRFSHRLATAHGYIYALLGMYEPFCDIERYDPQADQWTRLRPVPIGSFNYGMVSLPSGKLLLFGGRRWSDGQEVILKSVLEYDTMKDCWKEVCELPRPLMGTECSLLPLMD